MRMRGALTVGLAALGVVILLVRRARRQRAFARQPAAEKTCVLNTVAALHLYPVKSLGAGSRAASATIDAYGLAGDRRFMVYRPGPHPRFVTQRQRAPMALIEVSAECSVDDIVLRFRSRIEPRWRHLWGLSPFAPPAELVVRVLKSNAKQMPRIQIGIWDDSVEALDAGEEAARWLSAQLADSVRLCWTGPDFKRPVDAEFTPECALRAEGALPQVSFGDGFPILLASTASLRRLNAAIIARGGQAVPMDRFRPNIIVHLEEPFDEDRWKRVRIGATEFAVVKSCSRCKIPGINQLTGLAEPDVPQILRNFRLKKEDVYFGQNLIPLGIVGTIKQGDFVEVLERGEPTFNEEAATLE
ncbi:MOSC domain-containing protein [Pavlovales sp. CCMP2436]|nr:MOSC domain-containing protein [Pavlovales sp. CCMP2436]